MILDKEVTIIAGAVNVKLLRGKYPHIKKGESITISISDLTINSHVKINVKCDICGKEKKLSYSKYNKNISNGNYYSCSQSCAKNKNSDTYFSKYGYKHQMNNPDVIKKFKETCIQNFGYDHPKKCEEFKQNSIKTCLINHGIEYGFLKDREENFMNKLEVSNPMKSNFIKKKVEETNIIRYGNKCPLLNEEIHKKSIETMMNLYGVEYALQNEEIFNRMNKNNFKYKLHDCGILYQGSYEKDFLDLCYTYELKIQRGLTFKYVKNNKESFYFSDFLIEDYNLIVEVKSTWFYEKHKERNVLKKESVLNSSYDYILITDKNYDEFKKKIGKD